MRVEKNYLLSILPMVDSSVLATSEPDCELRLMTRLVLRACLTFDDINYDLSSIFAVPAFFFTDAMPSLALSFDL